MFKAGQVNVVDSKKDHCPSLPRSVIPLIDKSGSNVNEARTNNWKVSRHGDNDFRTGLNPQA